MYLLQQTTHRTNNVIRAYLLRSQNRKGASEIMTPQPQKHKTTEEYVINEHELFILCTNGVWDREERMQIYRDVQNRPSPSPQPICDRCKTDQPPFCIGCERLIPHDAAIRNATLDEAIKAFDKEDSDGFANMVRAKHIVNSLRTQEQ